ncbi:MAG: hypothetical protein NDP13_02235 [Crenarchaeota archaeon]|nr:hypothetical protein [Thermoproteota archaeon]MCR8453792.1 hypothetical protein [Thermoproteota archaeon]MCR8455152.1 hypothetical protein [Thermoproteota archaeon]MCR8462866.1 hypothetical protein [Thermoproteota archaeon]MCR8470976.1 hypothetical protein [Thermoproteota archaeon]
MSRWRGAWGRLDLGEKFTFVVYERWGEKFYVVVNTNDAIRYKKGESVDIDTVIEHPYVFSDVNKGILASTELLRKMLLEVAIEKAQKKLSRELTEDEKKKLEEELMRWNDEKIHHEAAKIVLEKGFVKIPEPIRDKLIEEKMSEILKYIQKYAVNPATNAPYLPQQLDEALKKVRAVKGVKLDPLLDIKELIPIVIKSLQEILPIKLEIISTRIHIPAEFVGPLYGKLTNLGTFIEQQWLEDGSLRAVIEVPAGVFLQFNNLLTNSTRGQAKIEIISRKRL